jgi:hypothetical protein
MNFESIDPETNAPNWGCPRLSQHGAGWLIDWYDAKGNLTGASVMKNGDACYCAANPEKVAALQAEVQTWLKGLA